MAGGSGQGDDAGSLAACGLSCRGGWDTADFCELRDLRRGTSRQRYQVYKGWEAELFLWHCRNI